jgi:rhodanese-related sulfurtransferase
MPLTNPDQLLATPRRYAGDVTPREAYEALTNDPGAVLVDCRTHVEWSLVGIPLAERTVFAEWTHFPEGNPNPSFLDELTEAGVTPHHKVYFICRSGQRSRAAAVAATAAGYQAAYNVSGGFEGPHNGSGRRDVAGWKVEGLPWGQS